MRILIATTQWPFVWGGAEFHENGLANALTAAGHKVDIVRIPYSSRSPEHLNTALEFCLRLDLDSCSPMVVDRVIGLKFPAYLVPHSRKVLWILHQQRSMYDLWQRLPSKMQEDESWIRMRDTVRRLDTDRIAQARAVFANSDNVANRLKRYNGIDATRLYHPPPSAEKFFCEQSEDYFLFPSRISVHKRHELILQALSRTRRPVKIVILGKGDRMKFESEIKERCHDYGLDGRCKWLGWVTEDEKIRLYAKCLAVIYPPYDEDLGYVTLESMLAAKPVITCADSGGPLEFVRHEESGLICDPTPEALATAMDRLWEERSLAESMGKVGRKRYLDLNLNWSSVVETLLH
jgi:glycosyltransferase involved in cell wall biosynthesis